MSLHQKVEQYLRDKIDTGYWKVGDCIPTEMELASTLSVSRPTVRQAVLKLANAGYIVRVKGKGSFITQPKLLHESTSMLVGYRQESLKQNRNIITNVLTLEAIPPTVEIAKLLDISRSSKVVSLLRLRTVSGYNKDKPVVLTQVYVPYDIFPQMVGVDFTQFSLYDSLEERGQGVRKTDKTLDIVTATPQQTSLLQLGAFEPLIRVTALGYTAEDKIVEYSQSYYPASSSKFQIRTER